MPDVEGDLVAQTVIVGVELLAVLAPELQAGVEGLLVLLGGQDPGPAPVDRRRRRRRTEDGGGTVWPESALSGGSVVLSDTQAGNIQRGLPWLYPGVVLEPLAGGAVVGHAGAEGDVPVLEVGEEEIVLWRWRLVEAGIVVRVTTVMDDTHQLGPVHVIRPSPVTSRTPCLRQLGVSLGGEPDPLPLVVTPVDQSGPVLQVPAGGPAVLPAHLGGVPWVRTEHRVTTLGPGGVVKLSILPTQDRDVPPGLVLPVHVVLQPVVVSAGVGEAGPDTDQAGEGHVVVVAVGVGGLGGVVTEPDDALQAYGSEGVVGVPAALPHLVGLGRGGGAPLSQVVSPVQTLVTSNILR